MAGPRGELQRKLLVRGALEREPVQRRDANALDRIAVLRGRVADVGAEVPTRMERVGAVHEPVAGDLGDDRRGGDGGARRVAINDRPLLMAEVRYRETVDQAEAAGAGDAGARIAQRPQGRGVQAAA